MLEIPEFSPTHTQQSSGKGTDTRSVENGDKVTGCEMESTLLRGISETDDRTGAISCMVDVQAENPQGRATVASRWAKMEI